MRQGVGRGLLLATALTAATVGAGWSSAGATERLDSFSGSCSVQGTNKFKPAATNTQQRLAISFDGVGTCSGTVNGRQVSNAPVKMHNVGHSDGSCVHASTVGPGHGAMTFADGTRIRYTFDFQFVFSEGVVNWQGQRSGSGVGHGTFLTSRTPPDVAVKCAGKGVTELPLDITLTTTSPLVSERHASGREEHGDHGHASNFSGSCQFSGPVAFEPPLTNSPRPGKQHVRAPGACSGTFVDGEGETHKLNNAPVTYLARGHDQNASCAAGMAKGKGRLVFRDGALHFVLSENRAVAAVLLSLSGVKGGSASGTATPNQSDDPATAVRLCAGAGIARTDIDIHITTSSISG